MVCGKVFQSFEAELDKALKPRCFLVCLSVTLGIHRCGLDDKRRDRAGIYRRVSSCKYSGAIPLSHLYAKDLIF